MDIENKKICAFLIICCLSLFFPITALSTGIRNTKHNLSVSGLWDVTASEETQICIFCHTPHNANPAYPLWNHKITSAENYTNYWSETLQSYSSESEAPPIDGFSKLCLSCHDGTIALGAVISRDEEIEIIPDVLSLGMEGYIGTDLSGTHPVSIVYNEALVLQRNQATNLMKLKWPVRMFGDRISGGDPDVLLYPTQGNFGVQCTSCHDPHVDSDEPPFWRKPTHDEVCEVCHIL